MVTNLISDRRILTFPAIPPCQSISPYTLLHALLTLTSEISKFRSLSFPIFRSYIREAFREIDIIRIFLEDVDDCKVDLPDCFVGLSELHVGLQKFRFLLHDCGRRGARIWLLMNYDRALSEFKAAVRLVSTALDVLDLDLIDVNEDVKEMVGMLTRQSMVEIGVDTDDNWMVRAVRLIFRQFRSGVCPNPADLRRVLDHLEVNNWNDCNEEIVFLEEEILKYSTDEDDELLGCLMGFMIYCRAVIFEVESSIPKIERKNIKCESRGVDISCLKPESFRCPISLELMTDPVTISTGQTYDRTSIIRWFKDGYLTCPVTGEALKSKTMVPNSILLKIIQDNIIYAESGTSTSTSGNKRRDLTKTLLPKSKAAAEATRMTASFLVNKLSTGSKEEKNIAAYEIRLLSKSSLFQRICLVEADSVPWLLRLLSSSDASTQDNAVASLLNLSKNTSGRKAIFEIGGTNLIVNVVIGGLKVEIRQNAAAILFYLSSVSEYRQEMGEIPEAISALVNLLKIGTYRAKKNALAALFNLLLFPGNNQKVISTGAIPVLNDLLTDEREDLVNDCIGILAKVAERKDGTNAILRLSSDIVSRLVQVLQSSTSKSGMEHSVSLMLSLCCNGGSKVISQSEHLPLLMPSLYSITVGGHPQASKKARSLINHIHQMYDQDYPVVAQTPQVEDHHVVHAL